MHVSEYKAMHRLIYFVVYNISGAHPKQPFRLKEHLFYAIVGCSSGEGPARSHHRVASPIQLVYGDDAVGVVLTDLLECLHSLVDRSLQQARFTHYQA